MKFKFPKVPKFNKLTIPRFFHIGANISAIDYSHNVVDSINISDNPDISDNPRENNIEKEKRTLSTYLLLLRDKISLVSSKIKGTFSRISLNKPNFKFNSPKKKLGLGIVVIILIVTVTLAYFSRKWIRNTSQVAKSSNTRNEVLGAKATIDINKEFSFPLKDGKGKEVSSIKYVVENAELRDEIVIKGQKATALKGKTFLVLNLKVTNEHNQSIQINTRDYIRLSLNGNENEWLAPDIHNDPVEIQAISTKYTRVGFPVNDTDKGLLLRVGEINGDKQTIPISFN